MSSTYWTPTARQLQVLRFVAATIRERGYPPSLREIAATLGVSSTNAAATHVSALVAKGLLLRDRGVSRGLRLTTDGRERAEAAR